MWKRNTGPVNKFENHEKIILRDFLALERTRLANERTLMSYIRASLNMVLAAMAFFQIRDLEKLKWLGYPSIVLSLLFAVLGILKFCRLKKQLKGYYSGPCDEVTKELS